jgi:hypothetical protein
MLGASAPRRKPTAKGGPPLKNLSFLLIAEYLNVFLQTQLLMQQEKSFIK